MKKVFLDTSFILSYVNSNDELHENALKLEEAEDILSQIPSLFVPNGNLWDSTLMKARPHLIWNRRQNGAGCLMTV